MLDGSANARKRMVDDLVEARQKILKENAEIERLRAAVAREFQPLARIVDRLYNALGCNDVMPVQTFLKETSVGLISSVGLVATLFVQPVLGASSSSNGGDVKRTRKQSEDQLAMVRASLGANLRPSDPTRSLNAVRAFLPEFLGGPAASIGYGGASSPQATSPVASASATTSFGGAGTEFNIDKQLSGTSVLTASIAEDEPESPRSDEEDCDRPLTRIELQKRAAKSFASLQSSPKLQPIRAKAVMSKKKKY
ncbi:unnamed protein product [Phytophthora fragariaefolia]|uniref:Unnamed protein product n=1 Tax=Phytophthora fragariaefolia TaxID=1490495 RepID=A0A9W6XKT5_9STRA|nr:unnamed protein product [Phytophthora fragariaefolia]